MAVAAHRRDLAGLYADSVDIWAELSAPLPDFRDLVRAYSPIQRQPGHDVSDEPRDEGGKWTEGGEGGESSTGSSGAASNAPISEKPQEKPPPGIHQPTKEETRAILDYQKFGYETINRGLREGRPITDKVRTLDGLINHYEIVRSI